jgi:hypothetical protein
MGNVFELAESIRDLFAEFGGRYKRKFRLRVRNRILVAILEDCLKGFSSAIPFRL